MNYLVPQNPYGVAKLQQVFGPDAARLEIAYRAFKPPIYVPEFNVTMFAEFRQMLPNRKPGGRPIAEYVLYWRNRQGFRFRQAFLFQWNNPAAPVPTCFVQHPAKVIPG